MGCLLTRKEGARRQEGILMFDVMSLKIESFCKNSESI